MLDEKYRNSKLCKILRRTRFANTGIILSVSIVFPSLVFKLYQTYMFILVIPSHIPNAYELKYILITSNNCLLRPLLKQQMFLYLKKKKTTV